MNARIRITALLAVLLAACLFWTACPSPSSPPPGVPEILVRQDARELGSWDTVLCGSAVEDTARDIAITIENTGTAALELTGDPLVAVSADAEGCFSIIAPPAASIAAGGSTTFTLRFIPATVGAKSAVLYLSCNDPACGELSLNASGEGTATPLPEIGLSGPLGALVADSGTYAFPSTLLGSYAETVFTIDNVGSADLNLSGSPKVEVIGGDTAMFTVEVQPTSPVAASDYTIFTLRFTPASLGAKGTTVYIANNDGNENPFNFTLSGTGTGLPEMAVKQGATELADGTGSYDFADTLVGGSVEAVFTIENTGTEALTLDGADRVALSGANADQFSVSSQPSSPVATSGSTTFTLYFAPTPSSGEKTATVSIANDDPDEDPYTFTVTGTAIEWHGIQAVDTTGNTGAYPRLIRFGNLILIAYYDLSNGVLRLAKSMDGGATWPATNLKTVDAAPGVGQYPAMAIINSGNTIYLSYYDASNYAIKFAKSTDGGATWPAASIKTVVDMASSGAQGTGIVLGGGGLCIAYTDAADNSLKLIKSTDGGATWPAASIKTIDATGSDPNLFANSGNVYVSYYGGSSSLKFAVSTDSGATWPAASIKILSSLGTEHSLFFESPYFYAAYQDRTNWRLRFKRSGDSGSTWPAADDKLVAATTMFGSTYPAVAGYGNNLYIAYYDYGNMDLKLAKSTDRGATWPAAQIRTVDSGGDVGGGGTNSIFVGANSQVGIAYWDGTNGDLKFAKSIDGGVSW